MIGLLIKDGYTLITEIKLLLLFIVIMLITQNDFLFGYGIFYAAMLPTTALGYDERAKWHKLANTMPYATGQLVGSKYLLGVLCIVAMTLFASLTKLIGTAFGNPFFAEDWIALLFIVFAALLMQAVLLPLMFWIGTERGRYLFILIIVVSVVSVMSLSKTAVFSPMRMNLAILLPCAAFVTAILSLVSFHFSKLAYMRQSS